MTTPHLTHRRPTRRMALWAGTGSLLLTLGLAGCAGSPGDAAVVADRHLAEDQVSDTVTELTDFITASGGTAPAEGALTRQTINRYVITELVELAADAQGVSVSPGEAARLRQEAEMQSGGAEVFEQQAANNAAVPPSEIDDYVRSVATQQALAEKLAADDPMQDPGALLMDYVLEFAGSTDVKVNPRFGTWNPADLSIGPTPDDLSLPGLNPLLDGALQGDQSHPDSSQQ